MIYKYLVTSSKHRILNVDSMIKSNLKIDIEYQIKIKNIIHYINQSNFKIDIKHQTKNTKKILPIR